MLELLQQGVTNAWFFVPTALLLGALHGLEPGHSKTLMAAFIVAVRGTARQAVLLGVAATISHTAIVWIVALGGMVFFRNLDAEAVEPYFQFASGFLIIGIASWMAYRTWQDRPAEHAAGEHSHAHGHSHEHGHTHESHHIAIRTVDTGHGVLALAIDDVAGHSMHWSVRALSGHGWNPKAVKVEIVRPDGRVQAFSFADAGGCLQSVEAIPEPVEFIARLSLDQGDHIHDYSLAFAAEAPAHDHDHAGHEHPGLDVSTGTFEDGHARAHAADIRRRFTSQTVTTGQIIMFGVTGGLIPCPAAITVLLLCLQLQQIWLGALLVLCFSIGLAGTLVAVGVIAAIGVGQASKRLPWFDAIARRAPYVSTALIVAVGVYVVITGWIGLTATAVG